MGEGAGGRGAPLALQSQDLSFILDDIRSVDKVIPSIYPSIQQSIHPFIHLTDTNQLPTTCQELRQQ